jgi:hypothetical protein
MKRAPARPRRWALEVGWWALVFFASAAAVRPTLRPPASSLQPYLTAASVWRGHLAWATTRVRLASGEVKWGRFDERKRWIDEPPQRTAPPPDGWTDPDFNDSDWFRECGPFGEVLLQGPTHWPATLATLSLRGSFVVQPSAERTPLTLDIAFSGGVAVYLNGREVLRAHLPDGPLTADTLADPYPDEAWLKPDGSLLRRSYDRDKFAGQFQKRLRTASVVIPADALRAGRHVLALKIHRAPLSEVQFTGRVSDGLAFAQWAPIGLHRLTLTGHGTGDQKMGSDPDDKTSKDQTPFSGPRFQVWNAGAMTKVRAGDCALPDEPLRPISLVAPRNGVASGQVVVSCSSPLIGLKAAMSALKQGEAAVSAQVRYALLDGPGTPPFFDGLAETLAAEVPTSAAGGIQPVWVTVHVPKDARPGEYAGTLSLSGPPTVSVPVNLTVADWVLPDPQDFASFLDLVQSPETLAAAYNVPMWSERHWAAIDRSFELMAQVGCKAVYVPLVRRTDFGNQHGMVRWIKKGQEWEPDLSIAEKYIDLAVKRLGRVPVVVLNVWHSDTGGAYMGGSQYVDVKNVGFPFTEVDPATGGLTEAVGPTWSDPEIVGFLKPAVDGLRVILRKHGIEESMLVGIATDMRPKADAVAALKQVAPDLRWAVASHPFTTRIGDVDVGYLAYVWGIACTPNPYVKPLYGDSRVFGWRNPFLATAFPRFGCSIIGHSLRQDTALPAYRMLLEAAITSPGAHRRQADGRVAGDGLRGVGRLGADFWHVLPARTGQKSAYHLLYLKQGDHAVNLQWSAYHLLSQGPQGALSSVRFEMLREGIQEAEARIFLERAILDGRLDSVLAARCQTVLDERAMALVWARDGSADSPAGWLGFAGPGHRDRTLRLYEAAASCNRSSASPRLPNGAQIERLPHPPEPQSGEVR